MAFIDRFYTFECDLSHSDRAIYTKLRFKIPRFEGESWGFFYTRIVAFCHAYQHELQFSQDIRSRTEPTLFVRGLLGTLTHWIDVGEPDAEQFARALKLRGIQEYRVYFFEAAHSEHFFHATRALMGGWREKVLWYRVPSIFLELAETNDLISRTWSVSLVDDRMFLAFGELSAELDMRPLPAQRLSSITEEASS